MTQLSRRRAIEGAGAAMLLVPIGLRSGSASARTETSAGNKALIPRAKLFGNPSRSRAQISPDGRMLSWLAPENGVLNLWVAPVGHVEAARAITHDRKRGISAYTWTYSGRHLLYIQDEGGDEDWHIFAVDVAAGGTRDLTPIKGIHAFIAGTSPSRPDTLMIGLNDRDKAWHDLWRLDVPTAGRELVWTNTQQLSHIFLDRQLVPRLAYRTRREGGRIIYRIEGEQLVELRTVGHEDDLTAHVAGFTEDGRTLYWLSSLGRDKAALTAMDWASGEERVLAEHPKADIVAAIKHPATGVVEAAVAWHLRRERIYLEGAVARDMARLEAALPGEVGLVDQTLDNRTWLVAASAAEKPVSYHLFNRDPGSVTELFVTRPELAPYRLAPMQSQVIKARDGLELTSYLTLPADTGPARRPRTPLPLVLSVHGGPWARDGYGFDPEHQWLADRGIATLSVNFRGSTGFGKAFVNAGDREWGRKMHEDLLDAVNWAVEEGIAERARVAIMGASYGGYATLAALTFTPEVFCCGVATVGPSNLETLLASFPAYWAAQYEHWARRVGDPRTDAGRALLRARSPLHQAHRISRPLLIGQGTNDPRVKQAEADRIVAAMQEKRLPVTYVLYPEEGHGFAVPENRRSFRAIAEAFLAKHLGVAAEPFGGDLEGARFTVPAGAEHVPGLALALAGKRP